jgi:DNA-binding NtrC family response regulator
MTTPRILCVHESGKVLDELRRTLEDAGLQVVAVKEGEQALSVLARERVDGIVLSYDMETPDGRVLRNQIRHLHPDTPMLLFSDMDEIRNMPLHVFSACLEHRELPELVLAD